MNGQRVEVTLQTVGERLDRALAAALPNVSRTQWQRLMKEGQVTIDGQPVKANLRLEGGERVVAILPPPAETELIPEAIPLDVRYEDQDLMVINKPAGMVMYPDTGHTQGTLVNAVLAYYPALAGMGSEKRPGIVHRLDKDTSGLIAVAKNEAALKHLQQQFKARTVGKIYLALVEGQIQPPAALIDAPIGRDPRQRKRMSVITRQADMAHARPAQTRYHTLISYDDFTLVSCELLTGRTHQLRVHLAYVGYPIVGDRVYGRRRQRIWLKRHFLHASELRLQRPSDNQEINVQAELPPELEAVLKQLEQ